MDQYEVIDTDEHGVHIFPKIVANLADSRPVIASVAEKHAGVAHELVRMANAGYKMLRAE